MASRKLNPLNYMIVDLPAAPNLTFAWSFGSLLGMMLVTQLVTGLLLAMYYAPHTTTAFDSVVHIQRDIAAGWALRTAHSNGASLFFFFLSFHMTRGLYFNSYRLNHTWNSGLSIFILSMATAFMGYLLPWGQMSYWGATVITNLFSTIPYVGPSIVNWMWGGFAVGGPTLTRFFTGHFMLPFLLTVLVSAHLLFLHNSGSSNPLGITSNYKAPFHPTYPIKDVVGFILAGMGLTVLVCYVPFWLGDPDNWVPANSMVTPPHIKPEWYFLWVYAILRSIPNKMGGVMIMVSALLVLYSLPLAKGSYSRGIFWWLTMTFIVLSWVGASPVEPPYTTLGLIFTIFYFVLIAAMFLFFRAS